MSILDVWVAKPGSACLVDDNDWQVRIDDAHGNAYEWAGTSYAELPAPHAHWAGTIPPGTYVVSARRVVPRPGEPDTAAAAVVAVGCGADACVRLFVAPREEEPKPPEEEPKPPEEEPKPPEEEPKPPEEEPKPPEEEPKPDGGPRKRRRSG